MHTLFEPFSDLLPNPNSMYSDSLIFPKAAWESALPSTAASSSGTTISSLDLNSTWRGISLPTELITLVLSFCDSSTLAACSRVSFSFLQIAGPILYEEVILDKYASYDQLFCKRTGKKCFEHLEPWLSVYQIKSLSLVTRPSTAISLDRFISLSSERIGSPSSSSSSSAAAAVAVKPIQLETLSVSLSYNGLIGYAPVLNVVLPVNLRMYPAFNHSSKFTFDADRRSWEIFSSPSWRISLRRVWLSGCCLRVVESGGGTFRGDPLRPLEDEAHGLYYNPDFFLVPSRAERLAMNQTDDGSRTVDTPTSTPLSIVFDLTKRSRLTPKEFYTLFLSQRRTSGLFSVPGLTQESAVSADTSSSSLTSQESGFMPSTITTKYENGMTILVKRESERTWIESGLRARSEGTQDRFVRVLVT